jgi:hypothetical protein
MKALVASLATAAILAGVAWANNVTPTHMATLGSRVSALERSNVALQTSVQQMTTYILSCLHTFQGAAEFGGYVRGDNGAQGETTTALDFADPASGETPDFYLITATHDCSKLQP